jgi:hypothetical protein
VESITVAGKVKAKAEEKESRGKMFQTGKSGNPKDRPKGALSKRTLAIGALLDGEAALTRKAIKMAKGGDTVAFRFCLERILPQKTAQSASISRA